MIDLDAAETYQRLDPTQMRERLKALPDQCLQAHKAASGVVLPQGYERVARVVLAGMGGSAIGGDLLADLAQALGAATPITTWRDYGLPTWAGPDALVIVSSYSGETEEAISAFQEALRRRARMVAITRGGPLMRLALEHRVPTLQVSWEGEPRTALGFLFIGPLTLLQRLALIPGLGGELRDAVELLKGLAQSYREDAPLERNPAKALAQRLWGRLPVVYGAGPFQGVARRWKNQLNENAKSWALVEVLPEADHNAVSGDLLPRGVKDLAFVLFLGSPALPSRIQLRYRLTAERLAADGVACCSVEAQGASPLAQILSLELLGSWASYYLALLYGVDPSASPALSFIKGRLRETGQETVEP